MIAGTVVPAGEPSGGQTFKFSARTKMMSGDEKISGADGETVADFAVNFEIGLLGIRNTALVVHHSRTCRDGLVRRASEIFGRNDAGGDESGGSGRREDCLSAGIGRPGSELIENPRSGIRARADSRKRFAGDGVGALRLRDEEEG